ncbi:MAG: lysophospholipid acyltransferase family protein, partial [bacterium]|nr:lysophospholipid acyltransferase family protein [bacterium]
MTEEGPESLPPARQPAWFKFLVRQLIWLAYGGYELQGLENVPREGPLIIAPTHRSYLDPILVSALLPRPLYYMAKEELFQRRPLAALVRAFGAYPVSREKPQRSAIRQTLSLLKAGGAVVIFPEGGIVNTLGELGFKGGPAFISSLSGAPILPIHIGGSNTLISWRHTFADTTWLRVRIGALIPPAAAGGRQGR